MTVGTRKEKVNVFRHYGHTCTFLSKEKRRKRKKERKAKFRGCSCLKYKYIKSMEITLKVLLLKTRSLRANFANFEKERGWILLISFSFLIFYSVSSLSYKFYPFPSFPSNFIRIQPYMCRYTVLISTFSSVIYNLSNFGTQFFDFPINLWNLRSTFRSSHVHS